VRCPTSAGTNENASRPALPTRSVSAEAVIEKDIKARIEIKSEKDRLPLVRLGFVLQARSVCSPPPKRVEDARKRADAGEGLGVGVVVVARDASTAQQLPPPPPTPPHKGEGSAPSVFGGQTFTTGGRRSTPSAMAQLIPSSLVLRSLGPILSHVWPSRS